MIGIQSNFRGPLCLTDNRCLRSRWHTNNFQGPFPYPWCEATPSGRCFRASRYERSRFRFSFITASITLLNNLLSLNGSSTLPLLQPLSGRGRLLDLLLFWSCLVDSLFLLFFIFLPLRCRLRFLKVAFSKLFLLFFLAKELLLFCLFAIYYYFCCASIFGHIAIILWWRYVYAAGKTSIEHVTYF